LNDDKLNVLNITIPLLAKFNGVSARRSQNITVVLIELPVS